MEELKAGLMLWIRNGLEICGQQMEGMRFRSDRRGLVSISKHAAGLRYTEVYLTIGLNKAKKTWYSLEWWSDCYGARPPSFCERLNRFSFESRHKLPIKPCQYQNKHDITRRLQKCGMYYLKLFLWHMIVFCLAWRSSGSSVLNYYIPYGIIQLTA